MKPHDYGCISLIIPAWNGGDFIQPCLCSLYETTATEANSALPIEVIVVDNGSTDNTAALLRAFSQVRLIQNPANLGFSHAINQGLHAAQGQVMILLNQDIVARPGWLLPVLERFATEPTTGIVGSKLLYPDGTVQHAGGFLLDSAWEGRHYRDDGPDHPIDFVTGAAFAIRRACWQAVGDFDEGFSPAYFEDVDYCLRAKKAGWAVVYEPRSALIHHESQSRGNSFDHAVNFHRQRFRCVLKHQTYEFLTQKFLPYERQRVTEAAKHDFILRYAIAHVSLHHSMGLAGLTQRFTAAQRQTLADQLISLRQLSLAQVSPPL